MKKFVRFHKTKLRTVKVTFVAILLLIISHPSFADGGRRLPYAINIGDAYVSNFYAPPGWQTLVYPYYLKSSSLWDANGNQVDLDVHAEGILIRPLYSIIPNEKLVWFVNGVIQTGKVSIKNPVTGRTETSTGVGDLLLAPVSLFYKLDAKERLAIYADFFLHIPLGDYKKGRLANLGTNQFSAEPLVFLVKGWRLGTKELYTEIGVNYLYNRENKDEHFRPGDMRQIQANLALITGQWTMGLTARHAASVNEDELSNQKVRNSKVRLTEVGAVASYQAPSNKYNAYVKVTRGIDGENTLKATTILGKIWFPF